MAVSITCAARRSGGVAYLKFSKREYEFRNVEQAREFVRGGGGDDIDTLCRMLVARWLEASADGASFASINGRTITFDPTINNIVRIT